jgi:quercetin dioxygenase-like cupin family protein
MPEPEVLFKSAAVLVRLVTLGPHEVGQKHYHSNLLETVICVQGEITLFIAGAERPTVLLPGHQASVPSRQAHWLENRSPVSAQYILAQSGGAYDFMPVI